MGVCSHKEKTQRKMRFQRLEKCLFFGDCLQLSVYTVKGNNTIFRFWFYRERGSKTIIRGGERREEVQNCCSMVLCGPCWGN